MADINVYGPLHAATGDGVVARAAQILDASLNKKQEVINGELLSAIEAERTSRRTADQSLAGDISGLTRSIGDLWESVNNNRTRISDEKSRAEGVEATLSASISAALATAKGVGSEAAWETVAKRVTVNDTTAGCLIAQTNTLLLDTTRGSHGVYVMQYSGTGSFALLLQGGLSEENSPSNASRGVTQMLIGNVVINATPDNSVTGTTWAEQGFLNGVTWTHGSKRILTRRRYLSGGNWVLTPWREWAEEYVLQPMYNLGWVSGGSNSRRPTYNEATGYYELNGLTDITPAEMARIWADKETIGAEASGLFLGKSCRTNIPWTAYQIAMANAVPAVAGRDFRADMMFGRNQSLEAVVWCVTDQAARFSSLRGCFYDCRALRRVDRMDFRYITTAAGPSSATPNPRTMQNCFYNCVALEDVKIEQLAVSGLSFAQSSKLSAASLQYLVDNAANTSAISVTVHPTIFDALNTLGTAYYDVKEAALAKNISFVS